MTGHEPVHWDRWTRLIAVTGCLAVVLGTIGFHCSSIPSPPSPGPAEGSPTGLALGEALLRSLEALLGHGGFLGAKNFSCLGGARLLGIAFAYSAVIRLLGPELTWSWLAFRARHARDHHIVIGLGRKGQALLEHPQLRGEEQASFAGRWWRHPVVTIDKIPAQSWELSLYPRPLRVVGDALEIATLTRANVAAAARVFIATRDDAVNLEIAGRIEEKLAALDVPPLPVFVHVADPVLRREAFPARSVNGVQPTPFALSALAARRFLSRFPLAVRARENGTPGSNVVIVGFDTYAEEMLIHALRLGPLVGQAPLRFTIFTPDAPTTLSRLERNYPAFFGHPTSSFGDLVRVHPLPPGHDVSVEQMKEADPDDAAVTAVLIHASNDAECFKLALRARVSARLHGFWKAPFFMRVDDSSQFAGHLRCLPAEPGSADVSSWSVPGANVTALKTTPFLEEVLDTYGEINQAIGGIVDGTVWNERIAQLVHKDYWLRHSAEKRSDAQNEWWRISEEFRDANRRAADHFLLKLASAGYVVRGAIPVLPRSLSWVPSTGAINPFARLEHESWCREKSLAGWRHGAARSNSRRIHESLVPFDELPANKQQLDEEPIAAIQQVLTATEPHRSSLGRGEQQLAIARRISQTMASGRAAATSRVNKSVVDIGPPNVFKERIIGLTGHSVVDPATAREAIAVGVSNLLRGKLHAQRRLAEGGDEFWTFITPLAPGSDLILAEQVVHQLKQLGLSRFRLRIVQALPMAAVVNFWRMQGGFQVGTIDGRVPGVDVFVQAVDGTRSCDENAVAAQLRAFIKDPKNHVESYVDMTSADLCTSWLGKPLGPAFRKTTSHLLHHCHELIVACDEDRRSSAGVSEAWALIQFWRDRYENESGNSSRVLANQSSGLPGANRPHIFTPMESTSSHGTSESTADLWKTARAESRNDVPGVHKIAVRAFAP